MSKYQQHADLWKRILSTMAFILMMLACKHGQFSGKGSSDTIESPTPSQNNGQIVEEGEREERKQTDDNKDSDKGDIGRVEVGLPNKNEKKAIAACNKAWGDQAINNFSTVRKIYAAVSVGGIGTTVKDTKQTNQPMLTVVHAGVNVGGSPVWQLENQNGWYCIVTAVNVGAKLTVRLAKNAKLADSKVAVNVGSSVSDEFSAIGVHVGSNIKVERID
ncbi:MAG: hypothetical protein ACOH5I_14605 [Oligoflexus sp.]